MTKTLSLIVPMHNEVDVIDIFFTSLFATLKNSDLRFEVVCINDGSSDNTLEKLHEWHSKNNNRYKNKRRRKNKNRKSNRRKNHRKKRSCFQNSTMNEETKKLIIILLLS